jgi:Spy/CpxP family protein refolding chaperone
VEIHGGDATMNKWKLWLGIVSVFIVGAIIGGLVSTTLTRHHIIHIKRHGPPKLQEMVEQRLTGNISLTDDQRSEIRTIVEKFEPKLRRFDRETKAGIHTMMDHMSDSIRTVLTPEQRVTFDRNLARMQERFKKREDRMRNREKK